MAARPVFRSLAAPPDWTAEPAAGAGCAPRLAALRPVGSALAELVCRLGQRSCDRSALGHPGPGDSLRHHSKIPPLVALVLGFDAAYPSLRDLRSAGRDRSAVQSLPASGPD